jgi:hypothetical protein
LFTLNMEDEIIKFRRHFKLVSNYVVDSHRVVNEISPSILVNGQRRCLCNKNDTIFLGNLTFFRKEFGQFFFLLSFCFILIERWFSYKKNNHRVKRTTTLHCQLNLKPKELKTLAPYSSDQQKPQPTPQAIQITK